MQFVAIERGGRWPRAHRATGVLAFAAMLAACTDRPATGIVPEPGASQMSAAVTGAAALALGSDGRFVLSSSQSSNQRAELTEANATHLATAWMQEYASMVQPFLEETHGGPVHTRALKTCGRPLYARSPFVMPGDDVPAPYRRPYGPWWLVTYCDGAGAPTVSVAVSAWATDLSLANGKIQFPVFAGNEFFPMGIPTGHVGEFPSSPEAAVTLVAKETGRRIAGVPELVMPVSQDGPPQAARWRLALDKSVTLRASGAGEVLVTETFVAPTQITRVGIHQFVASLVQPTGAQINWSPGPTRGEPGVAYFARMNSERHGVEVLRRADTPTRFEAASAIGGR